MNYLLDANGTAIYPGERVGTYDIDGEFYKGTLKFDGKLWFIKYDDGNIFILIEPSLTWKVMERGVIL